MTCQCLTMFNDVILATEPLVTVLLRIRSTHCIQCVCVGVYMCVCVCVCMCVCVYYAYSITIVHSNTATVLMLSTREGLTLDYIIGYN